MNRSCEYFSSNHWQSRLIRHLDAVWDITDLLDRLNLERDREDIIDDHVTESELSRDDLITQPLSETVERAWNLPITLSKGLTIETWKSNRGMSLPDLCPHPAEDGEFCLFHRPVADKDDGQVQAAFTERIAGDGPLQFVGARFGDLELDRKTIEAPTERAIDLRFAGVEGRLGLNQATVAQDIDLRAAEITVPSCTGTTFEGDFTCSEAAFGSATRSGHPDGLTGSEYANSDYYAEFTGDISFTDAEFVGAVDFKYARFGGDTSFNTATFGSVATFNYANFAGQADFMHAIFERKADFSKVAFAEYAIFYATFRQKAVFNYTHFEGQADFWSAVFHDMTDFWVTQFDDDADFRYADFHDYVSIRETSFAGMADFTGVDFYDDVRIDRVQSGSTPITMTDATLSGGHITQPPPGECLFDFECATIGEVRIEGPDPEMLLTDFRFLETDFDGFDFASHRDALGEEWEIHTFVDDRSPSIEELESTYLRAKNGANQVGDSKGASEFFLKEMYYRRQRYAENDARGPWLINWFYYLTCGYGERPLQTVLFSLATIVGFAGLYRLTGLNLTQGQGLLTYLIFSFQSFVTLILGNTKGGQSELVRLLAASEAFVGAFFIALFVFALTRTIHR